ncbi:hypothetical protein PGB90_003874 [Kerria lacca]
MARKRFRNKVRECKAYPGADIDSDHNLVVMKCQLKFKRIGRKDKKERWNLDELKEVKKRQEFEREVIDKMLGEEREKSIDGEWGTIKEAIIAAARKKLGVKKMEKKKPWMKEEILRMMEERRRYKQARD